MKNKWIETGVSYCDRTIRYRLNEMVFIEKSQKKTSTNTQTKVHEVKVGKREIITTCGQLEESDI